MRSQLEANKLKEQVKKTLSYQPWADISNQEGFISRPLTYVQTNLIFFSPSLYIYKYIFFKLKKWAWKLYLLKCRRFNTCYKDCIGPSKKVHYNLSKRLYWTFHISKDTMQNSRQWMSWQYKRKNQTSHYKKKIDML